VLSTDNYWRISTWCKNGFRLAKKIFLADCLRASGENTRGRLQNFGLLTQVVIREML
jgi:hypothetical protein